MSTPLQKMLAIAIGILMVLFLIFDGAGMSATTVNGDMVVTQALSNNTWLWLVPSFVIFGGGFLLAWVVLGEEVPRFNLKTRWRVSRSRKAQVGA